MGRSTAEGPTSTHYERLGVRPSASTDEIRTAYRTLAQRLHPDRLAGASPAERGLAERRMREINESWAVLRDPAARRRYDESRRGGARPRTRAATSAGTIVVPRREAEDDDDLVAVAPEVEGLAGALLHHLPWILLVVVLVGIFVVTAYAAGGDRSSDDPVTPSTVPVA